MVIKRLTLLLLFCCTLLLILPSNVFSVNFSINPIRIFFDGTSKTKIITIKNDSANKVSLQLKTTLWDQDEAGDSVYTPTKDIIFFPKMVEIEGNGEKIVRLGTRVPREEKEKTYRLFLEEMPRSSTSDTTAVQILMKVGVPVFITPQKADAKGKVKKIELSEGNLNVTINNEGNVHFIVRSIRVAGSNSSGEKIYNSEIAGRYIHHGKSRNYTIKIPKDKCPSIKAVDIDIDTDRFSLREKIDISKEMCKP